MTHPRVGTAALVMALAIAIVGRIPDLGLLHVFTGR